MNVEIYLEEVSASPTATTETTATPTEITTDYQTNVLSYMRVGIIALGIIIGCIIAAVVIQWFHKG